MNFMQQYQFTTENEGRDSNRNQKRITKQKVDNKNNPPNGEGKRAKKC